MKKLALTIAIAFMAFAANAQRECVGYEFESYDDNNIFENYGNLHGVSSYGDCHYVGSHYYNDDENEDVFTKIGLVGSRSASCGTDDYGYGGGRKKKWWWTFGLWPTTRRTFQWRRNLFAEYPNPWHS